jgi:hypothetical protein
LVEHCILENFPFELITTLVEMMGRKEVWLRWPRLGMKSSYKVREEGFETNTIVPNLNLYHFLNSSARLPPSGFPLLDVVRTGFFLIAPPNMCAILPSSSQAPAQLRWA